MPPTCCDALGLAVDEVWSGVVVEGGVVDGDVVDGGGADCADGCIGGPVGVGDTP